MADKEVIIYTTPTCRWCQRTKEYLSQKGVAYIEHNVAADGDKAREMIEKLKQMGMPETIGVPVIIIDGEAMLGFNQSWLDSRLP